MKYRWKNGDGEWVFIPIHQIKNSYLKSILVKYQRKADCLEICLMQALMTNKTRDITLALKLMDKLSPKLTAINDEFNQRECQGIENFRNRGRELIVS